MIDVIDNTRQGLDPKLRDLVDDGESPAKAYVYCASCSAVITRIESQIEVNGAYDHIFTNPYGFEFHVGCFRDAHGCSISGAPNAADSWFPGYLWRLALCTECTAHLGWSFEGGDLPFFGLILDRIDIR